MLQHLPRPARPLGELLTSWADTGCAKLENDVVDDRVSGRAIHRRGMQTSPSGRDRHHLPIADMSGEQNARPSPGLQHLKVLDPCYPPPRPGRGLPEPAQMR